MSLDQMNSKVLCACVIYPGVENYIKKCFLSIQNQTFKDFDLLIIEDELSMGSYKNFLIGVNYTIISDLYLSPIKLREWIMNYGCNNHYEKLIYFDSDDEYHEDRIKKIVEKLDDYDVVVHDMEIIDQNSNSYHTHFIGNKITVGEISISDILSCNFIGLGNSGYYIKNFKYYKEANENIIAFDWWLAWNFLHQGKGIFISESLSYYRRYDGNASNLNIATKEQLEKEFKVKTLLYTELLNKLDLNEDLSFRILNELNRTFITYENWRNRKIECKENKSHLWWDYL